MNTTPTRTLEDDWEEEEEEERMKINLSHDTINICFIDGITKKKERHAKLERKRTRTRKNIHSSGFKLLFNGFHDGC